MKSRTLLVLLSLMLLLLAGGVWLLWQKVRNGESLAGRDGTRQAEIGGFAAFNSRQDSVEATGTGKVPLPEASKGAIPGEYTVFFTDEASMRDFLETAGANGIQVLGNIPQFLAVRVRGAGADLQALLKDGMEVDNNYLMEVPILPREDLYQDSGLVPFANGLLEYLGIPQTPDHLKWGTGVTIAILDTGYLQHSALNNKVVPQLDLIDASGQGEYSGHGTAVAGMIGSVNSFAPGVAPGADLMSIRVLDSNGKGDAFTLAQGILAAVESGADIINMSLGGYGNSRVLQEAVQFAVDNGVVLVAASGNDGFNQLTYPAAYSNVIGVTAIDANDNRAPFANFGENLDVSAPGFQIHALWSEDDYIYFNGTSASSPIVAGLAARILESNPNMSPAEVYEVITREANDTGLPGYDVQYGAGIISPQRIEAVGTTGIIDLALADLYPATEQAEGGSFPLYVTLQNRGTDFIPRASVELTVDGIPYHYTFSGFDPGAVQSVMIPVMEQKIAGPEGFKVSAKAVLPDSYRDTRPNNNAGEIKLLKIPEG